MRGAPDSFAAPALLSERDSPLHMVLGLSLFIYRLAMKIQIREE
jgi:hypothetical protein